MSASLSLIQVCRGCGECHLQPVLDLGYMPLVDALRDPGQGSRDELRYPLEVVYCSNCHLLQLRASPSPEILFDRLFPYYSSFLDQWVTHAHDFAQDMHDRLGLDQHSFVVEIGSNDGYLLRHFSALGIPTLGIDPAQGPAEAAHAIGVPTLMSFFNAELGSNLASSHGSADLIVANNVLAHVPDPNELLAGAAALLKPDGVLSVEVPYVRDLIENGEFDTIYHEHHTYFSVTALAALFSRNGLFLQQIRRLPYHGGSLQVQAKLGGSHAPAALSLLAEEIEAGMNQYDYYAGFSARVTSQIANLRKTLLDLHAQGARVAAYGAAAKGAVLLNAVGIGPELCEFVADRNSHKQGKLMPGVAIPILSPEALLVRKPDYVLLLAWNWADEVMAQQQTYLEQGGRFIVPIPEVHFLPDV